MRLRSLAIYVVLLSACLCGTAICSFTVIGTGETPAVAVDDAVRQIGEIFGTLELSGSTSVSDYTVTQDQIKAENQFHGKALDRFYRGNEFRNGLYHARFYFDDGFLREVQGKERNLKKSKVEINWEKISYKKEKINSFGESHNRGYSVNIPKWFKDFSDHYLFDTKSYGPITAILLSLFGLGLLILFLVKEAKEG